MWTLDYFLRKEERVFVCVESEDGCRATRPVEVLDTSKSGRWILT